MRFSNISERVESLEVRIGEVALGTTGGLSELLQAMDGLNSRLNEQARVTTILQKLHNEIQEQQRQGKMVLTAIARRLQLLENKS